MDDEKRGNFLRQLRIEKNLTQKQVSETLHYSDNAISNWENGKTLPNNPETLMKLSELYSVSLEELLYGERKNNKNAKEISDNMEDIYKKNYKRFRKILNLSIILLLVIIVVSLISIYFIFIRGKILSYAIQGESENFIIDKSSILFTEKVDILNFNKVESINDEQINYIKVYYKINDNEYLIFKGPNDNYYIEEPRGYGEYNLNALKNNKVFIEIIYNDNLSETIELTLHQRFINNDIFSPSKDKISDEYEKTNSNKDIKEVEEFLTQENFERNNDEYEKLEKNIKFIYNIEMNEIYLYNQNSDDYEAIRLSLDNRYIEYFCLNEKKNKDISYIFSLNEDKYKNTNINFLNDNINYLLYLIDNL